MMDLKNMFALTPLSLLMGALVLFVVINVGIFATNHLHGDAQKKPFFIRLSLITAALLGLVSTNHLLWFLFFWAVTNLILSQLIQHKKSWPAAKASAHAAISNFGLGFLFLVLSFLIFMGDAKTASIQNLLTTPLTKPTHLYGGFFLILAALTQAGIWPFDGWLKSSLNAPTVVSSLMHAGIVNGGGFLVILFSPLISQEPHLMTILFIMGALSSFFGTFWKLIQTDVKRMLAASTIAQMGFMMVQCGLGLFPAALAHIFWHGLFKSHLFLSSSSIAHQEKMRLAEPTAPHFLIGLGIGAIGTYCYAFATKLDVLKNNGTVFLLAMVFIFLSQLAISSLAKINQFLVSALLVSVSGYFYGFMVHIIEQFSPLYHPQKLTYIHYFVLTLYIFSWLMMLYRTKLQILGLSSLWPRLYVILLNQSQPLNKTVTHQNGDYSHH